MGRRRRAPSTPFPTGRTRPCGSSRRARPPTTWSSSSSQSASRTPWNRPSPRRSFRFVDHICCPAPPRAAQLLRASADSGAPTLRLSCFGPRICAWCLALAQELEISKRQARDLATAPSVTYTQEPPYELKSLSGIDLRTAKNFVGFVSLAISKRSVEGGRLEKAVTLVEGYRAYLIYHVQATKSQLHTRIRSRSHTWLQVLNRAKPEKLNSEKKTISGRNFKR
uniref:Arp2/3 complex 34 kDa subunit n=1 Tax=Chrysotila carterae TaxID=13221 RepID=A0A6S9SJ14_CHRCT